MLSLVGRRPSTRPVEGPVLVPDKQSSEAGVELLADASDHGPTLRRPDAPCARERAWKLCCVVLGNFWKLGKGNAWCKRRGSQ